MVSWSRASRSPPAQAVSITRCSAERCGPGAVRARTSRCSPASVRSTSGASSSQRRDSKSSSRSPMAAGIHSSPERSTSSVQWKVPVPASVRSTTAPSSASRASSITGPGCRPWEAKAGAHLVPGGRRPQRGEGASRRGDPPAARAGGPRARAGRARTSPATCPARMKRRRSVPSQRRVREPVLRELSIHCSSSGRGKLARSPWNAMRRLRRIQSTFRARRASLHRWCGRGPGGSRVATRSPAWITCSRTSRARRPAPFPARAASAAWTRPSTFPDVRSPPPTRRRCSPAPRPRASPAGTCWATRMRPCERCSPEHSIIRRLTARDGAPPSPTAIPPPTCARWVSPPPRARRDRRPTPTSSSPPASCGASGPRRPPSPLPPATSPCAPWPTPAPAWG